MKASRSLGDWLSWDDVENVIIVGAGEVGAGLCAELKSKPRLGMRPVAFIDDDPKKVGRYVHGVLVADAVAGLASVAKRYAVHKAIIAFPSASVGRVRKVSEMAYAADLTVETVPALTDLGKGCAFAPRCVDRISRCTDENPDSFPVSDGHAARCWLMAGGDAA